MKNEHRQKGDVGGQRADGIVKEGQKLLPGYKGGWAYFVSFKGGNRKEIKLINDGRADEVGGETGRQSGQRRSGLQIVRDTRLLKHIATGKMREERCKRYED